ncbi:MAG: hypothetical protein IKX60_06295 [Bacteroidales bacterium]|nr:hypothetical protein [Bacteroidales bacterium]
MRLNRKRSIWGGIAGMLFLTGVVAPVTFSACDSSASMPEINIMMESDYSDIINAIKEMDGTLADKLAEILKAVNDNGGKTVSALDLIKAAIESMDGTMEEKLAAIEEAISESTLSLAGKLDLVSAALESGFASSEEAIDLLKDAIGSLQGTAEEKFAALQEAITGSSASLGTKLDAIETAVNEGLADNAEAQELIKDAIESLEGTVDEKLDALEDAVKNSSASLEKKLAAVESAVESGAADSEKGVELIVEAIEALGGDMQSRLSSIQSAVSSQTTSLSTKIALVQGAVETGAASNDQALDLIKTALETMAGNVDGIDVAGILSAIEGISDYSEALDTIIEMLGDMSADEPEEPAKTINGHEYVEMGHGLKWATMNVGATMPEEYGDYYAWGETEAKDDYDWSTYKHMQSGQSDWRYINKYTADDMYYQGTWYEGYEFIGDGVKWLGDPKYDYADDVARQIWGDSWRMPTDDEWTILRNGEEYDWTWTDDYDGSGVAGMIVTSKVAGYEGNTIFLPAMFEGEAQYWASTLYNGSTYGANALRFTEEGRGYAGYYRYSGLPVRAVSGDVITDDGPAMPDIKKQWTRLYDGLVVDLGYTFENYSLGWWSTTDPEYEAWLLNSESRMKVSMMPNGWVKVEWEAMDYYFMVFTEVTETTAKVRSYYTYDPVENGIYNWLEDEYGWHGAWYDYVVNDPAYPLTWRDYGIRAGEKVYQLRHSNSYPDGNYNDLKDFFDNIIGGSDVSAPIVLINGYGYAEDFEAVDVKGKIVMLNRGKIKFYEKLNNAAAAGAVAVICVDTEDIIDTRYANVFGSTYNIPFFRVSKAVGDYFGLDASDVFRFKEMSVSFVTVHDPNELEDL